MDIFTLSRNWFNFSFENPEKINPTHTALYFFCIEHSNRLGWKEKFGLPTTMAKEAIGIKSYNTYINALNDLVEWGFIKMIEKSKNQYSSNIIALSKNDKAHNKALDKALIKHASKQSESTHQSISSIDIQETRNNITIKPKTIKKQKKQIDLSKTIDERSLDLKVQMKAIYPNANDWTLTELRKFHNYWTETKGDVMKFELQETFDVKKRLDTWFLNANKNKR